MWFVNAEPLSSRDGLSAETFEMENVVRMAHNADEVNLLFCLILLHSIGVDQGIMKMKSFLFLDLYSSFLF